MSSLKEISIGKCKKLALIICTYNREEYVRKNLKLLTSSRFFDWDDFECYGKLDIFIVDNAGEIDDTCFGSVVDDSLNSLIHPIRNRNTGGAGGFQRGIEEVRRFNDKKNFSHVIFMDDDVNFELESFYILFDFLRRVDEDNENRPVAGRMLDINEPYIQWTAAERWNGGEIEHEEFLRNINEEPFENGKVIYDANADYGGFWFCCYPYSFVSENDILPLFIHCDDVEYGLRCGKSPIIIEGVHILHERFDRKISPIIRYYDMRNPLFINQIYGFLPPRDEFIKWWKAQITKEHIAGDYLTEYMLIIGMRDFLRGMKWLKRIDSEKYHKRLLRKKSNRWKNAILWRMVEVLMRIEL